jgi:hypothetical protein
MRLWNVSRETFGAEMSPQGFRQPAAETMRNLLELINLSHKWLLVRNATEPEEREPAKSHDLAEFRQFSIVSPVVSATWEYL